MRQRAKYGIDAPRVVGAFIVLGTLLSAPALIDLAWPGSSNLPAPLRIGAALFAALLLVWAVVMLRSSLVGKMRVRDRLVDALALSDPRGTPVAHYSRAGGSAAWFRRPSRKIVGRRIDPFHACWAANA